MSHDPDHDDATHDATTIRASKGGGAGKWLLGALAAVVVAGGGYAAWKATDQDRTNIDTAYTDATYSDDPVRAGPLESEEDTLAERASAGDTIASPDESEPAAPPPRRSAARSAPVPEATIGVTPASVTEEEIAVEDGSDIVVTAPPRPVWVRTPSERRLTALYPTRALERGREGEARLSCTVLEGGTLDCARVEETPGGFGTAAMRVARTLRHAPTRADGSNAAGTPVNLRVIFRIDDDREQRFASR
ncbi:MAG: energy transducer TonB [Hyphomonadaceae bacterium]